MYRYAFQPPCIDYVPYRGRMISGSRARSTPLIEVDTTPLLDEEGRLCVPGDVTHVPELFRAVWMSLVLNANHARLRNAGIPNPRERWDTELALYAPVAEATMGSLLDVVRYLDGVLDKCRVTLAQCQRWDDVLVAMAEGNTVMVGGSVYESLQAGSAAVPMPSPGERLLGGHMFNLLAADTEEDLMTASWNTGRYAGRGGLVNVRGSYLRNVGVCRDFFVLLMEVSGGNHN